MGLARVWDGTVWVPELYLGNDRLVIGGGAHTKYSDNFGATLTTIDATQSGRVIWSDILNAFVTLDSTTRKIRTSADGTVWGTASTAFGGTNTGATAMVETNSGLIVAGNISDIYATANGGASWSGRAQNGTVLAYDPVTNTVFAGGTTITWKSAASNFTTTWANVGGISASGFAVFPGDDRLYAAQLNGSTSQYDLFTTNIADAIDNTTASWTQRRINFGYLRDAAWDGVSVRIAATDSGIWRSTDGATWTNVLAPSPPQCRAVTYTPRNGGMFFVVGSSGRLHTSFDGGLTWTTNSDASTSDLYGVAYH